MSLSNSVKNCTVVLANYCSRIIYNCTWHCRNKVLQELFNAHLADKTNTLTVFLFGSCKAKSAGNYPNLCLGLKLAYWHQALGKRRFCNAVQKIALVFFNVCGDMQLAVSNFTVVPG